MKATRVANIGAKGRRRRAIGGIFWLVLGAAATALMASARARVAWYALLVVPFTLGALGFFQARAHT